MARQDILLIGLEYNSLRILEVSLRKAGFMVASVTSYPDAAEQIRIAVPDLIIIDSVKDADAFEFAATIKRENKNTPVILISSNKEINTRIRALEIGIDDYLVKPIYIKEIIARIRIHLQKREQKRVEEGITAGFIGSLSDIGLYDIVQTIELNRKSGILEIKGKIQD
ncbi:MAG: response regulator, partial [Deltaproteobacteria bacterium]|nr:response regulator [Deltaproteobacteria bacterium]